METPARGIGILFRFLLCRWHHRQRGHNNNAGLKKSSCLGAVAKLSLFCFLVPIFVYYKDMEINDLFTIRLNSEQHALLNECLSGVASLDLPPSHEDAFDSLWESVIEAEHELKFED